MVKKTAKKAGKIGPEMPISEVVSKYPATIEVFLKNGMHCIGCAVARSETVAEAAVVHGIDADKLMKELNKAVEKG